MNLAQSIHVSALSLILVIATNAEGQTALNLDGVDDFVQTTYPGISGNSARTVEAWIRTTANCNPTNGGVQQIITDWGSVATGGRFTFNILWGDAIRLEVSGNGLSGSYPVNDGAWHHVAAVYDPTAINTVSLYVDGSLDASGNLTVPVNTVLSTPMRIGKRVDDQRHFDGDIDEVRVWNYALSPSEISAGSNGEVCNLSTSLVAYYPVGSGMPGGNNAGMVTLFDRSGNGHNGTLTNFSLTGITSNWVNGAGLSSGLTFGTVAENACGTYTWPSNGLTYTMSGSYMDTVQNANGCDSLVTLNLTINTIDLSVTTTTTSLTSNQNGAAWQWLDCDNGNVILPGDTLQILQPAVNGNYAVLVDFNGCLDTSACYAVTSVGIDEPEPFSVQLYPNPVKAHINVLFGHPFTGSVHLMDGRGSLVEVDALNGVSRYQLNTGGLLPGVYMVQLTSDLATVTRRVIVE
jgi:hypothetical protein